MSWLTHCKYYSCLDSDRFRDLRLCLRPKALALANRILKMGLIPPTGPPANPAQLDRFRSRAQAIAPAAITPARPSAARVMDRLTSVSIRSIFLRSG